MKNIERSFRVASVTFCDNQKLTQHKYLLSLYREENHLLCITYLLYRGREERDRQRTLLPGALPAGKRIFKR